MRNAVVESYATVIPDQAARLWPSHPKVEIGVGLTAIARASAEGRPVGDQVFALLGDVARKAPLAPEPFLVRGVQQQVAGDTDAAAKAFAAAELRDGRSMPARYFLADLYFRNGDAVHGLREIAYLAKALPDGVTRLAPYVATYARDRRNDGPVRTLFKSNPRLADESLSVLADDPANAALVQSLGTAVPVDASTLWPGRLINALVKAGDYAKAHALWARAYHADAGADALLYNPDFREGGGPPPFNWALASSSTGIAERVGAGLHVIYYGQEEGELAGQLMLLGPGPYRLSARVAGGSASAPALAWTVTCANSNSVVGRFPLDAAQAGRGWTFTVPQNCPAQRLALAGTMSEMPQQADVTISGLKLERANG